MLTDMIAKNASERESLASYEPWPAMNPGKLALLQF
jgi:hypothetical protein